MKLARFLRHYKENRRKCTLTPLLADPRFEFRRWKPDDTWDAGGWTLLALDGPELGPADAGRPLLVLDATWRRLGPMRAALRGDFVTRSLPRTVRTAYPRVAKLGPNPEAGLASIEALYAALRILGLRDDSLLDAYRWRAAFLATCAAAGLD